jgi:hypothetical protein
MRPILFAAALLTAVMLLGSGCTIYPCDPTIVPGVAPAVAVAPIYAPAPVIGISDRATSHRPWSTALQLSSSGRAGAAASGSTVAAVLLGLLSRLDSVPGRCYEAGLRGLRLAMLL